MSVEYTPALPPKLAVDAKGFVWRVFDGEDAPWSMAPSNPDNEPIPEPVTFFEPVSPLSAAAPDLLEALETLQREIEAGRLAWKHGPRINSGRIAMAESKLLRRVRAAIAKAKGDARLSETNEHEARS